MRVFASAASRRELATDPVNVFHAAPLLVE